MKAEEGEEKEEDGKKPKPAGNKLRPSARGRSQKKRAIASIHDGDTAVKDEEESSIPASSTGRTGKRRKR